MTTSRLIEAGASETAKFSNHPLIVDDGEIAFLKFLDILIVFVGSEEYEAHFGNAAVIGDVNGFARTV